jgi:hypothetical protein
VKASEDFVGEPAVFEEIRYDIEMSGNASEERF